MTPPNDANPELSLIGQSTANADEVFADAPGLPPVGPRMIQRHGDDQERREREATWVGASESLSVGERVARYGSPHGDAGANPAFVTALRGVPLDEPMRTPAPEFTHIARAGEGDAVGGYFAARIAIEPGTSLYGAGEQAGPLLRDGRAVACWNADRPGYTDAEEGLYQSHPWVLGVRADGSAFGVLADTTHCCEVDLREGVVFRALGPAFGVVVIERGHPQQVVEALTELTGRIGLPPKWALGFQQSRWSYNPADRVLEVARKFREHRVPCDVFWIDIDYMDGYRVFTFDPEEFGDPRGLAGEMHKMGFRVVWMLDPGVKDDPADPTFRACVEGKHAVLRADGEAFRGSVWPGPCVFPDFTRAETRGWWGTRVADFAGACGFDGLWVDMNEPAVFSPNGTTTMPFDNVHRADVDLGGEGTHERYHNLYGMQMARATQEGVRRAYPERRPFVLTRSNFLGGHRYAATWTGDNVSSWDHLRWTIPSIVNMGLSGQAFVGCDIGGFMGDATGELYARWMGIGALLPFARAHSAIGTVDHEPWSFGEAALDVSRRALERRMRLLAYLYTLFHEAATTGAPVCRPVFFADPGDPALRGADASFLLGGDVLVRASVDEAGSVCPDAMPRGGWRRFTLEERGEGLPELFVRAGAVVPIGGVRQHVDEGADEVTLMIAPGADGRASGRLYEDDGDGHAWERGECRATRFEVEPARGGGYELRIESEGWAWAADRVTHAVLVVGEGGRARMSEPVRVRGTTAYIPA